MESHEDLRTNAAVWLLPVLIFALTVVTFYPALQNQFLSWDDNANFLDNPRYRGLGWSQLKWMFGATYWGHYQPLSWVTLALDYLIWGMDPFGYHLTNLVLHAANAVVFYFVCVRLLSLSMSIDPSNLSLRVGAAFAAVLFAIHPLRVESVAWVTERRDVLSGLFFLLTILWYVKAATAPTEKGYRKWMALTVAVYILSLLSKAVGMTVPAVLLVLDVYPLRRLAGDPDRWLDDAYRRVWLEKAPFVLLAIIFAITAAVAQTGAMGSLHAYGVSARLALALFGLAFYAWKTIIPMGLSPLYELPADFNPGEWIYVASGLLVVIATAILYFFRRRWPAGLAVWLYYAAMVAPVSGIVQSGPQLVADRYSYLSCLGWAVLAGGGLVFLWRRWLSSSRAALSLVGTAVVAGVVGLGYLTRQQVQVWHDTEKMWNYVIALDPNSAIAHNEIGTLLQKEGKFEEAVEHFRRVVRINPNYFAVHYNLGNALAGLGKMDEATGEYREAVRLFPGFSRARYNLGLSLFSRGQMDEAIKEFRKTLEIEPDYASAHYSLGRALAQKGQLAQAIKEYGEAVKSDEKLAVAYYDMGNAYFKLGKYREAVEQYRQAVKINPGYAVAYYNMGNALLRAGDAQKAIEQYRLAIKYDTGYAEAYANLGNALETGGKLGEAIAQYKRAVEINPGDAQGHYNLGNALFREREVEQAIEEYRRAVKLNPRYVEARTNLGSALDVAGKTDEAEAQFLEALKIDSRHAPARFNLGLLLKARGDMTGAMEQFRRVIEISPRDAEAHFQVGRLLALAGKVNEATEEFREALRLEPKFTPARQSLEQLAAPVQGKNE